MLLIIISVASCISETKNRSLSEERGDVVLIFNDIPINYRYYLKGNSGKYSTTGSNHEFMYMKYEVIPICYYPNRSIKKDTFIIKSISEPIEILHKYKGLDNLSFIAQANDTLYFNYKGQMPIITCSREHNKHDFNYERLVRDKIYKDSYSAYLKYNSPFFRYDNLFDFFGSKGNKRERLRKEGELRVSKYYKQSIAQLDSELNLLDSLSLNSLLSNNIAKFYKERALCRKNHLLSIKDKTHSYKYFKQNDSLIGYSFYKEIIDELYYNKIHEHANVNQKTFNDDIIRLYDLIQKNKNINKTTKKYLSYKCFSQILEYCTQDVIRSTLDKFKISYGDNKELIKQIISDNNLECNVVKDFILETNSGETTSLSEVINNNKGKIIYVDFWASWCVPCKKCIPESHKLMEEFKSEDIVFVYLAFNDKLNRWKQSIKELNLKDYKNSYFIKNFKTSEVIKSLEIESIPRFVIYGADGKLLYKNAPHPDDKSIRNILNDLIKKI